MTPPSIAYQDVFTQPRWIAARPLSGGGRTKRTFVQGTGQGPQACFLVDSSLSTYGSASGESGCLFMASATAAIDQYTSYRRKAGKVRSRPNRPIAMLKVAGQPPTDRSPLIHRPCRRPGFDPQRRSRAIDAQRYQMDVYGCRLVASDCCRSAVRTS